MSDEPVDLMRRRWEKNENPNDHKPIEAVKRCMREIESGKFNPRHIIVVFTDENGTGWFQAGNETHFGQVGLLAKVQQIMLNDQ